MTFNKSTPDFKHMQSNTKCSWNGGFPVDVTPEMASVWLFQSRGKNPRTINQVWVQQNIDDLSSGMYTSRTIRFHKDGWNCDGQHILTAIVQSGCTAKGVFVEVGLSDADVSNIDTGHVRSFLVTSKIAGMKANGGDSSLALVLEYGLRCSGGGSHPKRRKLISAHSEEIAFVNRVLKGARLKPVAMRKAIADVYLRVKMNKEKLLRLERFGIVYSKMDISGGSSDQAAINLAKAIERIGTADLKTRDEVYKLTIVAIDNFMKENPSKKLCMTKRQKQILK